MAEAIAQLIGAYALEILIILLLVVLGAITLLWRLFETYYTTFWRWFSALWRFVTSLPPARWLRDTYPPFWSFLGRRLSPDSYLGLHLTVGIIVLFMMGAIFSNLAQEVVPGDELARFDQTLAISLHQNTLPTAVSVFVVITTLGDLLLLAVIGVVVGLILIIQRRWLLLASWIVTLAGGGLLNSGLKAAFQRVRPELANPFITATGWSFPSGHAMGSLIAYGMLTYLLVLVVRRPWKKVVITGMVALVLLIGFSRMYLGVHFFSDIVAGYTAGAAWLAICISGTEVARRRKRSQQARQSASPETNLGYR